LTTYTNTYAYTRAQAVLDQVAVLYQLAGIDETYTSKVCYGVGQRWLTAVGLYLERDGGMVYEIEARINWQAYSAQPGLEFDSNLPGWEGTGSPEAVVVGSRVAAIAKREGLTPRFWVRFTPEIYANSALYRQRCAELGVGGQAPGWNKSPQTRSLPLQDLPEIGLSERSAL
jgi:hypothetical protein